ncbi:MAG: 3,4-dihydroxy-2-butanone-4-phosphate synthase [Chloroflexota bacterium]
MKKKTFDTVESALAALRAGKPIIVVDDENRENEGDLLIAAEFATPEMINFMAKEARGLICITMCGEDLDRLGIPMMVPAGGNTSGFSSPFTISVEAKKGVSTGISAGDRAHTVKTLIDPNSGPQDIAMPGHMFPLRANPQGVLARRGHTEAGIDLTTLAGLTPASVICEIMNEDGTMARVPALQDFAQKHGLKLISIEALVQYRLKLTRHAVHRVESAEMPTKYGNFTVTAYRDAAKREHLVLSMGDLRKNPPLIRLHSECLTGDVLGSLRCDCGDQLDAAMRQIAKVGHGAVLYLRQEGRGIGLANKIRAYALQDQGLDTVEANIHLGFPPDLRDFAVAAAMLHDQGVSAVRLMTNNPRKIADLEANHIRVLERMPHQVASHRENRFYMNTKAIKMNHMLMPEPLLVQ